MLPKQIDSITKADIDALISSGTPESKSLEFKRELPGKSDSAKKEFLADVTSFANGSGGDIVFGIQEGDSSNAEAIVPIDSSIVDETKLRLEEIIRNGVEPRLQVQLQEISGFGSKQEHVVFVLRIPKSFSAPHVVKYKGSFKFFSRHSAGKYQLDVQELRSMFFATDSQADRIRGFRQERLGRITADETPVQLSSEQRLVLHLIPLGPFLNNDRLDLSQVHRSAQFNPLGGYGHKRFNLDGVVSHSTDVEDGKVNGGYCQLFLSGVVETVSSSFVHAQGGKRPVDGVGGIASIAYERDVIQSVRSYFSGYANMGVAGPICISMALIGCKGSYLHVDPMLMLRHTPSAIDRDVAILPDVVVEDTNVEVSQELKPLFDAVWNACGYPGSFNYNEKGEWKPRG